VQPDPPQPCGLADALKLVGVPLGVYRLARFLAEDADGGLDKAVATLLQAGVFDDEKAAAAAVTESAARVAGPREADPANGLPSGPYGMCCGIVSGPGKPFTPHYFVTHGKTGSIDLAATFSNLSASDLHMAIMRGQMCKEAGQPVLYGLQSKTWHMWDGTAYASTDALFATRMAEWLAGTYRSLMTEVRQAANLKAGTDADALKKKLAPWGKHFAYLDKIWSEHGQAALIRQADRTCGVDEGKLDTATGEIVIDNGRISYAAILRDRRAELLPHDPGRLVTKRAGKGVRYDPSAQCPVFDQFITTSVADPAQRDWLLWRTVSALFGRMPRKGFVNLIGEHDSGKSTYAEIMHRLGGHYVITVPVKTFLARHAGDAGFLEAELRGARMVCAQEPKPGGRYDDGYMKAITGREHQRTAGKWEKPIEWYPQCTPFIGSNGPIRFASSDEAMMNRQEAVRFARGYAEPDPDLMAKLTAELPGILNRLLACALREAEYGPPPLPASMVAERERMADETKDALRFVAEWIEDGRLADVPPASVPVSRCVPVDWLYQHYQTWCEAVEGIKQPLGRKTFSDIVGRRYPR
jgi:P4 family phage/plasmid primase-like protien